jgi:hypothetical protein
LDAGLLRSPQSAAVESHRRLRWISILCAGQARRSSRWIAQSLRSEVSPEAERVPTGKPSRRAGPVSPGYRVATGGLAPTASGANSVASALGASPGATPARLCEHTMRVAPQPSKPELSTWLGVGTFYLAPTVQRRPVVARVGVSDRNGANRVCRRSFTESPTLLDRLRAAPSLMSYAARSSVKYLRERTLTL